MNGNSQNEVVIATSAGSSWIILPSQSRPGRIYYFNTLTGESAWNLSDADIEKARRTTKGLVNHGQHIEPKEPEEPPTNEVTVSPTQERPSTSSQIRSESSSKIYNKQIINNRFPRTQIPFSPFVISPCNQVVQNPINPLMSIGGQMNLTPFNNSVWAVPPTQPILLAPVLNHAQNFNNQQPFLNNDTQFRNIQESHVNVDQTTSCSGQFQNFRNKNEFNKSPQCHHQRIFHTPNRDRFARKNYQRNFKKNLPMNDLRSFLTAKKLNSQNNYNLQSESIIEEDEPRPCDKDAVDGIFERNVEIEESLRQLDTKEIKKQANDRDDSLDADWLEDNVLVDDKRLKLDVTNLKRLAKPNMVDKHWFIVTDDDVLLNHLNFLNILCNSDDFCQLMVPMQVMAYLRELANSAEESRLKKRARRALAFIKQLIDSNVLITGEGICNPDDTENHYLLDCGNNIFHKEYHVIILSNNNELKIHKNSSPIPMFTMQEIKQFLTNSSSQKEPEILEVPDSVLRKIKITVSNNSQTSTDVRDMETQADNSQVTVQHHDVELPVTDAEINCEVPIKSSVDVSIQTDTPEVTVTPHITKRSVHTITSLANSPVHNKENSSVEIDTTPIQTTFPPNKRREIRLNRSTSNRTTTSEDSGIEKKQFKWRKTRSASAKSACPDTPVTTNKQSLPKQTSLSEEKVLHYQFNESLCNSVFYDENDSETSSLNVSRNVTIERIVVDETSTSGIVSNTTSNVDSESDRRLCDYNQSLTKEKEGCNNTDMFAVMNQNMENDLRLRCDEWILRLRQVMEDVLRQVLQQDLGFLQNVAYKLYSSGPWSIVESTDCVIRKFNMHHNINDAAKKWKNLYLKLSDDAGKINMNLPPSDYMELYSSAVCLVIEMQNILPDCEDLQTAAQSLKHLLNDIQNPNLDASHNETLDHPQELLADKAEVTGILHPQELPADKDKVTEPKENENAIVGEIEKPADTMTPPKPPTPANSRRSSPRKTSTPSLSPHKKSNYNLRSKEKSLSQSPQNSIGTKENDAKTSFFSNLYLLNKTSGGEVPVSKTPQKETIEPNTPISTPTKSTLPNDEIINGTTNYIEPKIVRKFTFFPEYESKIRSVVREPLDLDALDYCSEEELDVPQNCENGLNNNEKEQNSVVQDHNEDEFENDDGVFEESPQAACESDCQQKSCKLNSISVNYSMSVILTRLLKEIAGNLSDIRAFCVAACEKLNDPDYSSLNNTEMHDKAKKLQCLIGNLCQSLNCINDRELCEPKNNNIQTLMVTAGINDNQLQYYRDTIGQYLKQAQKLQEAISCIINNL